MLVRVLGVGVCGVACHYAVTIGAPVLDFPSGRLSASLRPLGVYIYSLGSQSCRIRLTRKGSAPLPAPIVTAHGHCGYSSWRKACVAWGVTRLADFSPESSLPFNCGPLPSPSRALRFEMRCRRNTGS